MKDSSDNRIENIIDLLKKGLSLSEDNRLTLLNYLEQTINSLLFDTKKEYELIYADKEREEDILADTMAVSLQKVKPFRNGNMEEIVSILHISDLHRSKDCEITNKSLLSSLVKQCK